MVTYKQIFKKRPEKPPFAHWAIGRNWSKLARLISRANPVRDRFINCPNLSLYIESGGHQSLSSITGAKAYERFAGPQIRKRWKRFRAKMLQTEAVSLVSSFASTLLLGRLAPIDASDAAGTNLVDVKTKNWAPICLNACAVDEESRRAFGRMLQVWAIVTACKLRKLCK